MKIFMQILVDTLVENLVEILVEAPLKTFYKEIYEKTVNQTPWNPRFENSILRSFLTGTPLSTTRSAVLDCLLSKEPASSKGSGELRTEENWKLLASLKHSLFQPAFSLPNQKIISERLSRFKVI